MNEAAKPHALLRPRIAIPFVITALIWGSTWYVITGQIDGVPAAWSVTWRFMIACPAMFLVAIAMRKSLRIGQAGHLLAIAVGFFQFCANFGFVYRAEAHLTSGIVAVMFGMMILSNTLLGWWFLGQSVTRRFLMGSAIAIIGIALLLVHEAQLARLSGNISLGIWLTVGGILAASIANVIQANETGRALPMASLLAWAMLYGVIFDFAIAWVMEGPPVLPRDPAFWAGTAYLALLGSVVTFPLYYQIVREIGPGRAAYNGVLVITVAMLISTFIEGYEWSALAVTGAVLALVGMILALRAKQA